MISRIERKMNVAGYVQLVRQAISTSKHRGIILFAAIGALNTVIDIGIFLGLRSVGLPILTANIISTSIALIVSFLLNNRYTFGSSSRSIRQSLPAFLIVTLCGLWILQPLVIAGVGSVLQTAALRNIAGSAEIFNVLRDLIGKLAATVVTLVWNYVLYKKFVFKP